MLLASTGCNSSGNSNVNFIHKSTRFLLHEVETILVKIPCITLRAKRGSFRASKGVIVRLATKDKH
jgi:hypothetical protein